MRMTTENFTVFINNPLYLIGSSKLNHIKSNVY